ncbi:aquaporin-10 isoform X1 [Lynx canadensis]|uniref:aquaporin-10 isoform X1 n=1 Tax=Lynx canadensis TaxID=61383 RepID=UPI0013C4A464|nr:aquaporin-10 isoform X1 [Lynx canadensis]
MLHSRLLADVKGRLRIRSHLARQCLAEFLGVFVRMVGRVTGEGKRGGGRTFLPLSLRPGVSLHSTVHHFCPCPCPFGASPRPSLPSQSSLLPHSSSLSFPSIAPPPFLLTPRYFGALSLSAAPLPSLAPGFQAPHAGSSAPHLPSPHQLLTQGAGAQAVTSGETKGNFFTMFLAGSLAVTIAIYVGGNVSGAHLNPAFSLAMCLLGRLPWARLPIYCLVQLLSAFCASGATYAVYYDALQNHTGGNLTVTGPKETASLFATYPAPYLSLNNGFLDQVLGTGVLIVGILAILGTRNKGVPAGLEPVAVGLAPGANCGFPLNPARDLGPRLFTYVAGRGPEVFSRGCVLRHVCPVTFWHCDRITRWVYSENSLRQEAGPSSPGVSSLTAVICCQDLVFPAASIPPGAALGRFSCYRPWSFRERLEDSP